MLIYVFLYILSNSAESVSTIYNIKQKNCDNNLHAIITVSLICSYYE